MCFDHGSRLTHHQRCCALCVSVTDRGKYTNVHNVLVLSVQSTTLLFSVCFGHGSRYTISIDVLHSVCFDQRSWLKQHRRCCALCVSVTDRGKCTTVHNVLFSVFNQQHSCSQCVFGHRSRYTINTTFFILCVSITDRG